jgi:hypothetical protein
MESELRKAAEVANEALRNILNGNDLALERKASIKNWRESPFRKRGNEAYHALKAALSAPEAAQTTQAHRPETQDGIADPDTRREYNVWIDHAEIEKHVPCTVHRVMLGDFNIKFEADNAEDARIYAAGLRAKLADAK